MIKQVKDILNKNNIDGYLVSKNDSYFTEYSNTSNLELISNFTGSAGFAIILKEKNYLFVDGRYTLQAKKQSGKKFEIFEIPYIWPKNLFNKLKKKINIGFDPNLFTYNTLNTYFEDSCNLIPIKTNIFKEAHKRKALNEIPFFLLKDRVTGESARSKINKEPIIT